MAKEGQIKKELVKRIAIDVDGTITKEGHFPDIFTTTPSDIMEAYNDVEPDLEMIKWVNKMYDKGYTIYLFTSRSDLYQAQMKTWLKEHKVKHHFYIMGKPYYDMIIDDKAVTPDTIKMMERALNG